MASLSRADILSAVLAALMLLASAAGLVVPHLYRDNLLVASGWRGNDLVTLGLAVPAFANGEAAPPIERLVALLGRDPVRA